MTLFLCLSFQKCVICVYHYSPLLHLRFFILQFLYSCRRKTKQFLPRIKKVAADFSHFLSTLFSSPNSPYPSDWKADIWTNYIWLTRTQTQVSPIFPALIFIKKCWWLISLMNAHILVTDWINLFSPHYLDAWVHDGELDGCGWDVFQQTKLRRCL